MNLHTTVSLSFSCIRVKFLKYYFLSLKSVASATQFYVKELVIQIKYSECIKNYKVTFIINRLNMKNFKTVISYPLHLFLILFYFEYLIYNAIQFYTKQSRLKLDSVVYLYRIKYSIYIYQVFCKFKCIKHIIDQFIARHRPRVCRLSQQKIAYVFPWISKYLYRSRSSRESGKVDSVTFEFITPVQIRKWKPRE